MSRKYKSTSRHQASTSSTHPAANSSAWVTPRPTFPFTYDQFANALNDVASGSAPAGTGDLSRYQSSSSARGQVVDTSHYCLMVYTTWACGHQTADAKRHCRCWRCSNLDPALCNPEPVDIDKTGDCRACEARHEQQRRHRQRSRAAAANEEIRQGQLMELHQDRETNARKRKRSL